MGMGLNIKIRFFLHGVCGVVRLLTGIARWGNERKYWRKMDDSVFINILNWNGWEDTIECIESCLLLQYPNFQIVVVDNGSEDDSVAIFRKSF